MKIVYTVYGVNWNGEKDVYTPIDSFHYRDGAERAIPVYERINVYPYHVFCFDRFEIVREYTEGRSSSEA